MSPVIPHRMIEEKLVFVVYVTTQEDDGSSHYYYIAVRAREMEDFRKSLLSTHFDPEALGIILESGKGEPDTLTRERMRIQYGCVPEKAITLTPEIKPLEKMRYHMFEGA
jgi:hypothetical protein